MYLPLYATLALERGYTLSTLTDKKTNLTRRRRALSIYESILQGDIYEGARIYTAIGSGNAKLMAKKLGFSFEREDLLLSLGYGKATPLELASAYGAIANSGKRLKPYLISKIETNDKEMIYRHRKSFRQVFKDSSAYIMNYTLAENSRFGSAKDVGGFHDQLAAFGAATDDMQNAWYVGALPNIVTSVWVGAERGRTTLAKNEADAARVAGRILKDFNKGISAKFLRNTKPVAIPQKISFSRIQKEFKLSRSIPFVLGTAPIF
jgi:membrane peptidoglycan carboxypeptidase